MRSVPVIRLRRRRAVVSILTLLVLLALVLADRNGWLLVRQSDDLAAYHGVSARVNRAIDGDTIEIEIADTLNNRPATRVRLWGVNSPEESNFGRPAQPWAAQATAFTRSLTEGRMVTLELESSRPRDSFSRILAHVTLADGRTLNEELLAAGLAKADDRWPHARLVRYSQIEMTARKSRLGVWSKTPPPIAGQ